MTRASKEVKIINALGLHARPASKFVQLAGKFRCKISVRKGTQVINGKSVMGMMMLAAAKGSKVTIEAEGDDAEEAIEALENLIKEKFGEEG